MSSKTTTSEVKTSKSKFRFIRFKKSRARVTPLPSSSLSLPTLGNGWNPIFDNIDISDGEAEVQQCAPVGFCAPVLHVNMELDVARYKSGIHSYKEPSPEEYDTWTGLINNIERRNINKRDTSDIFERYEIEMNFGKPDCNTDYFMMGHFRFLLWQKFRIAAHSLRLMKPEDWLTRRRCSFLSKRLPRLSLGLMPLPRFPLSSDEILTEVKVLASRSAA